MAGDPDLERTRRFSASEVKRIVGLTEPTADRLFAKCRTVLGQDRANQCLELAKMAPLTRRHIPTSAIASLLAGTTELGADWWAAPHRELTFEREWIDRGAPNKMLAAGHDDPKTDEGGSCLSLLGEWIADDAADKAWGMPIDHVDLNDPAVDGRVVLPAEAAAGDRFTAIYAPGARVWLDVVEREGAAGNGPGRYTSRLAEHRLHDVAEVRAAWAMAASASPVRLPGEMPGRASDPYAAKLDAGDSRCLFEWAVANGANGRELAGPWRTKDALWSARLRLGLLFSRPGAWITFDEAVVGLIDDDNSALSAALAALGC
jgi:hypothetical protein